MKIIIEKHHLLHKFVSFQMPEKDFGPEGFLRLKYFSEKLPLSLKSHVISDGAVSHNVLYFQQLSVAKLVFVLTYILSTKDV